MRLSFVVAPFGISSTWHRPTAHSSRASESMVKRSCRARRSSASGGYESASAPNVQRERRNRRKRSGNENRPEYGLGFVVCGGSRLQPVTVHHGSALRRHL